MSNFIELVENVFIRQDRITGLELTVMGDLIVVADGRCYTYKKRATRKDLYELKKKLEKNK